MECLHTKHDSRTLLSLYSTTTQNYWRRGLASGVTPKYTNMLVYFNVTPDAKPKIGVTPDANPKIGVTPDANPRRQSVEYRWRWVFWRWPCIFYVYFMYISCIFHVYFMLFVHHFPRWLHENWPTQTQFPVEYGLKSLNEHHNQRILFLLFYYLFTSQPHNTLCISLPGF